MAYPGPCAVISDRLHTALLVIFLMTAVPFFSIFPSGETVANESADADFLENVPAIGGAYQKEALLTLFYDGSTYGELHPCPT